jgi:hypothetical protein
MVCYWYGCYVNLSAHADLFTNTKAAEYLTQKIIGAKLTGDLT